MVLGSSMELRRTVHRPIPISLSSTSALNGTGAGMGVAAVGRSDGVAEPASASIDAASLSLVSGGKLSGLTNSPRRALGAVLLSKNTHISTVIGNSLLKNT